MLQLLFQDQEREPGQGEGGRDKPEEEGGEETETAREEQNLKAGEQWRIFMNDIFLISLIF